MEARLVPESGYAIEFVRSGGLQRVGLRKQLQAGLRIPLGIAAASRLLRGFGAQAVFSTGGYASGPVMIAALLRRMPLIVMEPNAIPGLANRRVGPRVYRALVGFETTRKWFPAGKSEVTGLPVRPEFFDVQPKQSGPFTVLITGGSRGARTLNRASRELWPIVRQSGALIRVIHQTGAADHEDLARAFETAGIEGEVAAFIRDMPGAFAQADLIVSRAGAGAVNELAAAGMPSVLVPLPYAADDHQRRNAEALVEAGAARMLLDAEMDGARLFQVIEELRRDPATLDRMRARARQFARPGAAERAAQVMEEAAARGRRQAS